LGVFGSELHLWDLSDPAQPSLAFSRPDLHAESDIAFSPDGHQLLTEKEGAVVWSEKTSREALIAPPDVHHRVNRMFSAKGDIAVIGSELWDIQGPDGRKLLATIGREVQAINPDGTLVAGAGLGEVTLWNISRPAEAHTAGTLPHPGPVEDVLFTPNGQTLITASKDNVRLWDLGNRPAIAADTHGLACRLANGGLTSSEWKEYVPDTPFHTSCPAHADPGVAPADHGAVDTALLRDDQQASPPTTEDEPLDGRGPPARKGSSRSRRRCSTSKVGRRRRPGQGRVERRVRRLGKWSTRARRSSGRRLTRRAATASRPAWRGPLAAVAREAEARGAAVPRAA
jgi:hypothetical protein